MLFDALGPEWVARLYAILDRREPKVLGLIRSGTPLSVTERKRVTNAVEDEALDLMGTDLRMTIESEELRPLISALGRVAPFDRTQLPGYGTWDRSQPINHDDPLGDGGAAAGYGPRPGTTGEIPEDEMPTLHLVPDDYRILPDPSVAILGPRRPDEPQMRRYPLERPDDGGTSS
jgi:hypothetical protein